MSSIHETVFVSPGLGSTSATEFCYRVPAGFFGTPRYPLPMITQLQTTIQEIFTDAVKTYGSPSQAANETGVTRRGTISWQYSWCDNWADSAIGCSQYRQITATEMEFDDPVNTFGFGTGLNVDRSTFLEDLQSRKNYIVQDENRVTVQGSQDSRVKKDFAEMIEQHRHPAARTINDSTSKERLHGSNQPIPGLQLTTGEAGGQTPEIHQRRRDKLKDVSQSLRLSVPGDWKRRNSASSRVSLPSVSSLDTNDSDDTEDGDCKPQ